VNARSAEAASERPARREGAIPNAGAASLKVGEGVFEVKAKMSVEVLKNRCFSAPMG